MEKVALRWVGWLGAFALLTGCNRPDPLFRTISSAETGITFANRLTETDSLNAMTFEYMYNGAGVGVGDFNQDGRPDLYFAGNQVSSRLYLNQTEPGSHNLRFSDVTTKANVGTNVWCTGVSVADVNQDGWPDIYVCVAGPPGTDSTRRANKLFINLGSQPAGKTPDGVPRFREMAADYGLADTGYSTQAAFFDYDRDGDLDCYVLTNALETINRNALRPKRLNGEAPSTDRLYRNDGASGQPHYVNVSRPVGILAEGYGLGLCVSDLNDDNWPDVYCADDFLSNDLVWLNGGRSGGFRNVAGTLLKHQTHNGMGVDVADYNNDARPDVIVLDMLPEGNFRQKMMLPGSNYNRFMMDLHQGYEPQYMRNTLQLNQGAAPDGLPRFSDVGQLAGVSKTDWSWAPLLADLDNDGHKDLFITNGYRRDITNLDFITSKNEQNMFGTPEIRLKKAKEELFRLPEVKIPNYAYRNRHDLTFDDVSETWGLNQPSYANGAAYADLDNDGDLDLITNNIDDEAFVLQNQLNRPGGEAPKHHYVRLAFRPDAARGLPVVQGTKVWLYAGQTVQMQELSPVRGYVSTVENALHFGLGTTARYDSLVIRYPNGQRQSLRSGPVDRLVRLAYRPEGAWQPTQRSEPAYFAELLPAESGLNVVHTENRFVDFNRTPLLPHQQSLNGPGLAVGDANGDGLDDVFVGADFGAPSAICFQQANGTFRMQPLAGTEAIEPMGALFFDADRDGDQDLYVVSGGSREPGPAATYQDQLYLNTDGRGTYQAAAEALPPTRSSGSCVVAADYDRDGDLDLFRAGRVLPSQYPKPADSYLLRNDGRGRFADVTDVVAPGLRQAGLITAALWTDADTDNQPDLLLAGEWMPITLLRNQSGKFSQAARPSLRQSSGWWNSLVGCDFDQDGDTDYVAGNLGLNTKYQASANEPLRVFANDYDNNGTYDPILTYFLKGEHVPVAQRDVVVSQIPAIKRRFPTYEDYASHPFEEMFTGDELAKAQKLAATQLATCYIENRGGGNFVVRPLPLEAQMAPAYGLLADDFTGDGLPDLLLAGNSFAPETIGGWHDAGRGLLLAGNGRGQFRVVRNAGLHLDRDAKAIAQLTRPDGSAWLLVANNNGPLQVLRPLRSAARPTGATTSGRFTTLPVRTDDAFATVTLRNGRRMRCELYHGAGYLAQSSRRLVLPPNAQTVTVITYRGQQRTFTKNNAADRT